MKKKVPTECRLLPLAVLLLAVPSTASAHSTVTSLGYFAGGVLHPLTTPTHLLVLIGLGLICGQSTPPNLQKPLSVFIPVSALALCFTLTGFIKSVYIPILVGVALVAGILIALQISLPWGITKLLFAAAAMAIGLDSAVETGNWIIVTKTLLGTWMCLAVIVGYTGYYISHFSKKEWQKIGVRVIGSWITAASLMILAFTLRR